MSERGGIPLTVGISAANRNDHLELEAVVDAVTPIKGPAGRPRRRPHKLHADKGSETCDNTPAADGTTDPALPPNLIANVATTHAAVPDSAMTMPIHTMLADRDLLPAEHLLDAGYPCTKSLLALRTEHQVRLIGPMRGDSSRHAREGSPYVRDKFAIDFDRRQVTCPQGHRSATWNPGRQDGHEVIVVSFPLDACIICPARTECTHLRQRRRQLTLRPRHLHEALRDARAEQQTDTWKQIYRARAGIEGTIHQATAVSGIRQAR